MGIRRGGGGIDDSNPLDDAFAVIATEADRVFEADDVAVQLQLIDGYRKLEERLLRATNPPAITEDMPAR